MPPSDTLVLTLRVSLAWTHAPPLAPMAVPMKPDDYGKANPDNVSPLREEADAHHVHVGEHCLACVRHGVALASASEEIMGITSHVTAGQCSCGEYHAAAPPSEEATTLHDRQVCTVCGRALIHAAPPSEEATDRCSHCGVPVAEHPDTDACAIADDATPPSEEATGSHLWQAINAIAPDEHYASRVREIVRAFFVEK